jgi:hypothetical protein
MKLQELLSKLDSKEIPFRSDCEFIYECLVGRGHRFILNEHEALNYAVNLDEHGFTERPIKCWKSEWHGDCPLGTFAVYWNGEFICIITRGDRYYMSSADVIVEKIQWASEEVFNKVSDFVKSQIKCEEQPFLDFDEEYEIRYKLESNHQLIESQHEWAVFEHSNSKCKFRIFYGEYSLLAPPYVMIELDRGPFKQYIRRLEFLVALKDT